MYPGGLKISEILFKRKIFIISPLRIIWMWKGYLAFLFYAKALFCCMMDQELKSYKLSCPVL